MKADFINPFLIACEKIIKVVLQLDVSLGKLSLKESHDLKDILVVIIGIKGDFNGRVIMCFPHKTAISIASKMMNKYLKRLDDISRSAIGELVSMILGRSGIIFSNSGINVLISPPTVVQATKLNLMPTYEKMIVIPLVLSNGDVIDMEIEMDSHNVSNIK